MWISLQQNPQVRRFTQHRPCYWTYWTGEIVGIYVTVIGMLNSFFSKFELCKIWILFELVQANGRVSLFWLWLYANCISYHMAFMWWCSILGPGRILHLLIASFTPFCVCRTLQQKQQHQCIIYRMHCQSLLSENSGQISTGDSNTECMQIKFKF